MAVVVLLFTLFFEFAHRRIAIEDPASKSAVSEVIATEAAFGRARIEWFIALMAAIGVAGSAWAVLARKDAERAFLESVATRKAVFEVIPFSEIPRLVTEMITDAVGDLVVVLGVPAIGFFRPSTRFDARLCCSTLINCINNMVSDEGRQVGLDQLKLVYLANNKLEELADKAWGAKNDEATKRIRIEFKTLMGRLSEAIKSRDPSDQRVRSGMLSEDSNLRFVIGRGGGAASDEWNLHRREKAIFWFVSGFDDETPEKFDSVGFVSRDLNLIACLKGIAEERLKSTEQIKAVTGGVGVVHGLANGTLNVGGVDGTAEDVHITEE